MVTMTRGQLARRCGVGPETIRFYERRGLLPDAPRTSGGYRRFDETAVARLIFIRRAKALGFSLPEIAELLSLHDDAGADRSRVKQITEAKLKEVSGKLEDLQRMKQVLSRLARQCSGEGTIDGCPIIEALTEDAGPAAEPGPGERDRRLASSTVKS